MPTNKKTSPKDTKKTSRKKTIRTSKKVTTKKKTSTRQVKEKKIKKPTNKKIKKSEVKQAKKREVKIKKAEKQTKKTRRKEIKKIPQVVVKYSKNPILSPQRENHWEAWQTFNPGVILLENKIHFLYRAIGYDSISRFGYAFSEDGFYISGRLSFPVYEHRLKNSKTCFNPSSFASGGSFGGCEDPRLTRVDDEDKIYMIYTACDDQLRLTLTSIKVNDFLNQKWSWRKPIFISPSNQFHKNWVIFPEKINGKYALLTSVSPEIRISYFDSLDFKTEPSIQSHYSPIPSEKSWETVRRGVGPPPLRVKDGWLVFYHGQDLKNPSFYKVGAMILSYNNPEKILHLSSAPILEPKEIYELNGYKPGVIYTSGAVIKGDKLLIYYGAADSYIGVAWANLEEFLDEIRSGKKPKISRSLLKKKR